MSSQPAITSHLRSWPIRLGVAAVTAVLLIGGVAYFQPQKLFINERVNETLSIPSASPVAGQGTAEPQANKELSRTPLQSLEHGSSGTVLLIQVAGDARVLRLENLATSNGPDLRVYLSTTPASSSWYGYDRDYVDLGALKGNLGNQNYPLPAAVDVSRYRSTVIWCRRFKVGFAVAPLTIIAS